MPYFLLLFVHVEIALHMLLLPKRYFAQQLVWKQNNQFLGSKGYPPRMGKGLVTCLDVSLQLINLHVRMIVCVNIEWGDACIAYCTSDHIYWWVDWDGDASCMWPVHNHPSTWTALYGLLQCKSLFSYPSTWPLYVNNTGKTCYNMLGYNETSIIRR